MWANLSLPCSLSAVISILQPVPVNPCIPSPCGPNSQCRVVNDSPSCSCLPNYFGIPPNCKPECTINAECASNLACIREKCVDPCPGSCGISAQCAVVNHIPTCTCTEGFIGDPFTRCIPKPEEPIIEQTPSCNCGPNAICLENECTCPPEYFGDPYKGCRPECILNTECPTDKVCLRNKCINPCPGTCATNAECAVVNHIPICTCPPGHEGNAFIDCRLIQRKGNLEMSVRFM